MKVWKMAIIISVISIFKLFVFSKKKGIKENQRRQRGSKWFALVCLTAEKSFKNNFLKLTTLPNLVESYRKTLLLTQTLLKCVALMTLWQWLHHQTLTFHNLTLQTPIVLMSLKVSCIEKPLITPERLFIKATYIFTLVWLLISRVCFS